MPPIDFKKQDKALYFPGPEPNIISVPPLLYIMVDGSGDPNTSPAYKDALQVLYGLSYAIKMSPKSGPAPADYFEYVVPPLEGLWTLPITDYSTIDRIDKESLVWTSMIRQPEFVTPAVFLAAKSSLARKKPKLDLSLARLELLEEGLCAQVMHTGSYDEEPATIRNLVTFIHNSGYSEDFASGRRHHEIYLNDPQKTAPQALKTVIRHPIRQA